MSMKSVLNQQQLLSVLIPLVHTMWQEEHDKAVKSNPERLDNFLKSDLSKAKEAIESFREGVLEPVAPEPGIAKFEGTQEQWEALTKKSGLNFEQALYAMSRGGRKVRLPEWRGYWFFDTEYKALTKTGSVEPAWINDGSLQERKDWEVADGLDFWWALTALKAGKLVQRKGWNGKGMFLFIRPADELAVKMVVQQVKSLPQSVKDYFHLNCTNEWGEPVELTEGSPVKFTSYLCMKAADGTIVNGWLASQTDMLADDWCLFE